MGCRERPSPRPDNAALRATFPTAVGLPSLVGSRGEREECGAALRAAAIYDACLTGGWTTLPGEYRAQRMISGIVGFLPYMRMPTR